MEGTDIHTGNATTNVLRDRTYYGNGCTNSWDEHDTTLHGGSTVSCSSRIVETHDHENQSIGAYYTYQAASAGSGGAIETDNTNSPDSFCPLGWQMPYGGTDGDYYDKSKSIKYWYDTYEYTGSWASNEKVRSYPFSAIQSGDYYGASGVLMRMTVNGNYFTQTVSSENGVYRLMLTSGVGMETPTSKYIGFPIRCVFGISILV